MMPNANTVIDQAIVKHGLDAVHGVAQSLPGIRAYYASAIVEVIARYGLGPQQTVAHKCKISLTRVSQVARELKSELIRTGLASGAERAPVALKDKSPYEGPTLPYVELIKAMAAEMRNVKASLIHLKRHKFTELPHDDELARLKATLRGQISEVSRFLGELRPDHKISHKAQGAVPTAGLDGRQDGGVGWDLRNTSDGA